MSLEDLPLCEVLPAHRFDVGALERYLRERIEDLGEGLAVRQFQGGASNPTFLLTAPGAEGPRRFVLRKKPPGQLLASAHQVEREYRAMDALRDSGVPVPRMRALCEDPAVIGTTFYVMDFLDGRIFRDATLPELTKAERAAVYDDMGRTLVKLHQVDFEAVGLGGFGRPGQYFERQIARWTRQYRDAQTETIPAMERLLEELPRRVPADVGPTIAHGDYRLGNIMYHPTEPRVIAVLDWELSTIGHPLADLGYNAFMWHSDNPTFGSLAGVDFAASGIPSEAAYVEAYCRRTGAGIDDWDFYLAFAVFRLAAIMQGGYRRVLQGNSAMGRAADGAAVVNGAPAAAALALELLHRGTNYRQGQVRSVKGL
jgi:aminoglycoside phosphotransferase (APT) family kinase protein